MTTPGLPDTTTFVNLTIYDKSAVDLYNAAIANIASFLPEWVPREGNVEVVMLEAFCNVVEEAVYAINRLPNAMALILLQMFGVYRSPGVQPVATLQFTVQDTQGYTIPIGTAAALPIMDGIDPVVFTTDQDLVIPAGQTVGTVSATGDRFTVDANTAPAATPLGMLNSLQFLNSVVLVSVTESGTDPDTDANWIERGAARLSRISDALLLPRHFSAYAIEQDTVHRATAIDSYNPTSGHAPGGDAGHVTVAVYGFGTAMSTADKADLLAGLQYLSSAQLNVHLIDATVEVLDVSATVYASATDDPAVITSNVQNALAQYLSVDTWNWSQTVHVNNLISVISNAPGVRHVSTINAPTGDVTYTAQGVLVALGTLNLTVVGE
jgi:hypothetical protein